MMEPNSLLWIGLAAVVGTALLIDLLVHRRENVAMSSRSALIESGAWITLALLFDLWIWNVRGRQASIEFLTGYLVEKSLSIDNIFIFLVVFRSFEVTPKVQHKLLYYGVAGALVLRLAFVFTGVALLDHFHWVVYLFGAVLFFTAARMVMPRREGSSIVARIVRLAGKFLPISEKGDGKHFFVRENGKRFATSLLLALLTIEAMDVIFATDSIPAVLSITRDTFIVYSSNVFAVLGLRAIYFVVAGILQKVRFLHQGLAAVLTFTGLKMVLGDRLILSDVLSLAIIGGIFGVTAIASFFWPGPARTRNISGG
jgi:tellurite resistance protein TerC